MPKSEATEKHGFSRSEPVGWGEESAFSMQRLAQAPALFEQFLYGLVLVERDGRVLYLNRKARQLLTPGRRAQGKEWRCCDLICDRVGPVLGGGCMSERVAGSGAQLPEVRIDIDSEGGRLQTAAWVSGSRIAADGERLLFHLRPGSPGDRRRRTPPEWSSQVCPTQRFELQIVTLGRFSVEGAEGPLSGEWVEQRPGQLLKYLVGERRRVVPSDKIAEAMWPGAGPEEARNRLRYYVHALRERLEPDRGWRSPSRFIVARRGGYMLDTSQVWVDADEFEREAKAGLAATDQNLWRPAASHLAAALSLYQDGFLAEDPYSEWAIAERERLQELAGSVLRAKMRIQAELGNLDAVVSHARRLAELEPFDTDIQKLFFEVCLRQGRRSEAFRRYSALRKRMLANFGHEPDFDLAGLVAPADG
ncbi:MAG TPA: BTAD domain-containing putative transcriptional regulator [Solirubrobacterales bacterium]|nr:BTAD domain-containing putative transcriptional regulator [Solirubrobacterales bacterium]